MQASEGSSDAGGFPRRSARVRLELNLEAPSPAEFARVAMDWLHDRSIWFMRPYARAIDQDVISASKLPEHPDGPWGPGGAIWGRLIVSRADPGPPKYARRPANHKGWRWLEQQLQTPPWHASVDL